MFLLLSFRRKETSMLTEIVVCLEEWAQPYPTGALAKSYASVVDSEYCETAEEFGAFFEKHKEELDNARLVFSIAADDLDNEELMRLVKSIQKEWFDMMWPEPEPES